MENMTVAAASDDLRYPIGDFDKNITITPEMRFEMIQTIRDLPTKIAAAHRR